MESYLVKLGGVLPNPTSELSPRFHSSLRGKQIITEELDGKYRCQNLISPVLFSQAVTDMCRGRKGAKPVDMIIEIGPHSSLKAPVQEILKSRAQSSGNSPRYLPSLLRNEDGIRSLLQLAGALHCTGYSVQISKTYPSSHDGPPELLSDLPPYPWLHNKRYWHETRISKNNRFRPFPRHDLLGALVEDFNEFEPRWRNVIRLSEIPWLSHHLIQSSIVFPFAAYVSMACEATFQRATRQGHVVGPTHSYSFKEILVKKSLILTESFPVELSLTFRPSANGTKNKSGSWDEFSVYSHTEERGWSEHCSGMVSVIQDRRIPNNAIAQQELKDESRERTSLVSAHERACRINLDCAKAYAIMSRSGMEYGSSFRNVTKAKATAGLCCGTLTIPNTAALMPHRHQTLFIVHPTILDSCLHIAVLATRDISLRVPTYVKSLRISHRAEKVPGDQMRVFASAAASKATKRRLTQ